MFFFFCLGNNNTNHFVLSINHMPHRQPSDKFSPVQPSWSSPCERVPRTQPSISMNYGVVALYSVQSYRAYDAIVVVI